MQATLVLNTPNNPVGIGKFTDMFPQQGKRDPGLLSRNSTPRKSACHVKTDVVLEGTGPAKTHPHLPTGELSIWGCKDSPSNHLASSPSRQLPWRGHPKSRRHGHAGVAEGACSGHLGNPKSCGNEDRWTGRGKGDRFTFLTVRRDATHLVQPNLRGDVAGVRRLCNVSHFIALLTKHQ